MTTDQKIAYDLLHTNKTQRQIMHEYKVGHKRLHIVAEKVRVDLAERGVAIQSEVHIRLHKRKGDTLRSKWFMQESMTKDGLSLEWLSKKW